MDKSKDKSSGHEKERVIDLTAYRKNKSEQRRREYERVLFNRILGVYSFAEKTGLHHVEVVDISYSGIRFREIEPEKPTPVGDKIALRFYFTPTSYLRMIMVVKRCAPFESDDGKKGLEYGCELDKDTKSYEVIKSLVSFMYKYSEIACKDDHPPMMWY